VFTLQFFPFIFLMVSAAINAIDRSLEEAATNLGAGRLRVFFTVTLPLITPAILSGGGWSSSISASRTSASRP